VASIADNLAALKTRIASAAARAGRNPVAITLVAVTKTRNAEEVTESIRAGVTDVGENRVQESLAKKSLVNLPARWHLIGSLQTNKTRKALDTFDIVQSVDSLRLAEELDRRCASANRKLDVLLEVNTSAEKSKHGIRPEELPALLAEVLRLDHLRLTGLMTIGPGLAVEAPEASRPCFRLLARLAEDAGQAHGIALPHLSMGMSSDFEVGIEEGATIVRIGTAIFGPRPA
jgi:pyridoxal phosphate enzyme (YggS family)